MTRLQENIVALKKEKNAILLAHYYQSNDIQEIADFVGDSLQLSRKAANTDAEIIVFCGVHFMAETAKLLNPDKKVLIPDLNAGCSLADNCRREDLLQLKAQFPDHKIVTYINCSAEVKAISDLVCTSSNAKKIIQHYPPEQPIIFAPDKNLGKYLEKELNRPLLLWDGACVVHEGFSIQKIIDLKLQHPNALVIAHPESEMHILGLASFIGSTSQLIDFVQNSDNTEFIIATEVGILNKMRSLLPKKTFIPAPTYEDNSCACGECAYMKVNTLSKVYHCLENESPEIILDVQIAKQARIPVEKMLALS